jgi:hypothetical protein
MLPPMNKLSLSVLLITSALLSVASADERRFTYVYEPEVLPRGSVELEQWVTLRTQRTGGGEVQQTRYRQWEFREEVEYGVTDRYSVSLYLNATAEQFRDVSATPAKNTSIATFTGVSLENRYQLLNPANHAVGLTLYVEPRFSGVTAELEQMLILGQRIGDWKWALNLSHATEWGNHWREKEGEVELSFGLARDLGHHWSLGVEFRNHNELPDYSRWENTAFFLGPVVSYRREHFWATLTLLPQIYGRNFLGDPDGHHSLDLAGHERLNARLIFGFNF